MSKTLMDITFINSRDTLILKSEVIDVFKRYEQQTGKNEAGGILLGQVYPDFDEIIKVTTPNIFDKLGRFFFVRSKNGAQPYINRAWKRSSGKLIYLGEWHTHCEMNPKPSFEDKRMIEKVLNETVMEINFLYLIIVGQNNSLWIGKQTQDTLIELKKKN